MEACAECSRNCVILHGKNRNTSPNVSSFFKVMVGSQFSELLYIPPKFSPTVSGLLNQNIHLEDSGGGQWEVTLSAVDGSLAFQRGWNAFSCDHGLEVGYFLLFYYLGSHFRVDIYDRTGCRKVDFPENRMSKKRTVSSRNSPDDPAGDKSSSESASVVSGALAELDQSHCRTNVEEAVKQTASTCLKSCRKSQPLAEELSFMINRDTENREREEVRPAFDLFDLEMKSSRPCAGLNPCIVDGNGPSSVGAVISQLSHNEAGLADKDPILDSVNNWTCEETNRHIKKLKKSGNSEGIDKQETLFNDCMNDVLPVVKRELMEMNEDNKCKVERPMIIKQEPVEGTSGHWSTKMANQKIYGKEPIVKAEYSGSNALIASDGQPAEGEPINAMASLVDMAADASYSIKVVTDCHSHLELPADLPLKFFKGTSSRDRKVVYLKDPSKRMWPVLYHERSGLRLLTSGWDGFRKANCIQQGDECVFQLKMMSSPRYLYEVSITRFKDIVCKAPVTSHYML
ncbi:uncharacterized protein LOC115749520 isoform X2 [Rhodamnia argentea]|uniref:Uncharacterized protein LOC115749520 isoform X2 n=1 Tax=Rhodamnia argentea TaxID=178133 RepID=A0A8B8Q577_9MYRT|nr:uncharacterized protein LOC115749520 isoform X2 [Rhodamnia argentea]XP_048138867.1 uncharacterized protein LOC115749520 isoform X2 [Rhodamnia argentea]